jgi:hypothetical protein
MHTLTTEELTALLGAAVKKEPEWIAGKFKENYIYSGPQHDLIKRMAVEMLRMRLEDKLKNKML